MDLSFSTEEEAFRAEVRSWIASAMPPHIRAKAEIDGHYAHSEMMEWHKVLAKKGWVTAAWGQTEANQRAKFYTITPEGKKQLAREESRWSELVTAIGRVMRPVRAGDE